MPPPQIDLAEASRLYLEGETLRALGKRYSTSPQTVGRRLEAAGIPLRGYAKTPQHRAKIASAHRLDVDHEQLRALASTGRSTAEIGRAMGLSEETVRRRMRDAGLPRLAGKARPDRNHFWNGGRIRDVEGYLLVKTPTHPLRTTAGYVREHRLVMEAHLGRLLTRAEVVDHRSGVVDDNRLENLCLYPTNAEHLRATLSGKRKQSRRQQQYPLDGPIPSASETGADPWLSLHPLWPFVPSTVELRP